MLMTAISSAKGSTEVPSGNRTVPDPRLMRAAREFEAQMMKELLAPMNHHCSLFENDGSEETGVMGEFASESLAGALSVRGGLGIADRIVHEVSRSGHSPGTDLVTGKIAHQ